MAQIPNHAALQNIARQEAQQDHDKPRIGFAHNYYTSPLGKLFQKNVKGAIEKVIGTAWPLLVRYRVNGDRDRYREGLKNPDTVFVYDDELLETVNSVLKRTSREYLTDCDSKRKQQIVQQSIDMILMLAFEDIYYRPLLKLCIQNLVVELAQKDNLAEILELDPNEAGIIAVFNNHSKEIYNKKARIAALTEFVAMREKEAAENGAE